MFVSRTRKISSLVVPSYRTITTQPDDVLFNINNNAGTVILNRPKDLNCLTTSMMTKILPKLCEWENNKSLVITKGSGERAFCAGGDVKMSIDKVIGPILFWHEYNMIYIISRYRIPYVSLNDRYTLGGGLGISVSGKYRVVTERTIMAMPENKIGLCPDAGGTYFLPRLPSKIGFYLGLTGESVKGYDTIKVGLATNFVPSHRLQDLENALSVCKNKTDIDNVLQKFGETPNPMSEYPYVKDIEYCFSAPTLEEIFKRLETTNNEWSNKTLESIYGLCPGSLKVTFKALNAGAKMDLQSCLKMEYRLTCNATLYHDFPEGVRARLVDKDNSPKWSPTNLSEVTPQYVDNFFKQIPDGKDLELIY